MLKWRLAACLRSNEMSQPLLRKDLEGGAKAATVLVGVAVRRYGRSSFDFGAADVLGCAEGIDLY